jgi:hypothetical protein
MGREANAQLEIILIIFEPFFFSFFKSKCTLTAYIVNNALNMFINKHFRINLFLISILKHKIIFNILHTCTYKRYLSVKSVDSPSSARSHPGDVNCHWALHYSLFP